MPADKLLFENDSSIKRNRIVKKKKLDEFSGELQNKQFKKKKLQEKKIPNGNSNQQGETNCFQYESTKNYAQVIARPESLQSVPEIFSLNPHTKLKKKKSNFFIFDVLSNQSLNASNELLHLPSIENSSKTEGENSNQKRAEKKKNNKSVKKKVEKKLDSSNERKNSNSFGEKLIQFFEMDDLNGSEFDGERKIAAFADFYETTNKNVFILHLHHPSKFTFLGELKLTLVAGEIEMLGYTLSESSQTKTVKVYSPEMFMALVVESKSVQKRMTDGEICKNLEEILTRENLDNLLANFKKNDSVLLVEKFVSNFGTIIQKYTNFILFPENPEYSSSDSLKTLQSTFKFDFDNGKKEFRKNLEWDKITLKESVILAGGKGVGKSTLLKYCVNKLICQSEKVLVLDFDPGQPEFTPPGYVSAVIVDKPLLGPNFTHVMEGELMVYFGGVNTNQFPLEYLKCVDHVIRECRKNEELSKMKWLVNTMGFAKGLGIEFMVSIIKLVKPKTVIQIESSDDQNNYPFRLNPIVINGRKGFGRMDYDDNLSFDHWVINSSAEIKNKQIHRGLPSCDLRTIMTLSYLSQMLNPPYHNFNSVQPYAICFSKLYLGINFMIRPEDVLKAFNGNIVSLSHFEPGLEDVVSVESQPNDYFKIVLKPNISHSFGLGFIRGIDCEKKKLYLITHLELENFKNLNCLTLGQISSPSYMFLKQDTIEGPSVYTSISTNKAVKRVKRTFRK